MDSIVDFLEGMTIWRWWMIGGAILVIELLTGTTYLLWPAAAAFMTGLFVMGFDIPWQYQLLAFAVLTTILTVLGDRFVRPQMMKSDRPNLNKRANQLVGARAVAISDFVDGVGRVKIGDVEWGAELTGAGDVITGQSVTVTEVDSASVTVKLRGAD